MMVCLLGWKTKASLVGFNLDGLSFAGFGCPLDFLEKAVFDVTRDFFLVDFAIKYFSCCVITVEQITCYKFYSGVI